MTTWDEHNAEWLLALAMCDNAPVARQDGQGGTIALFDTQPYQPVPPEDASSLERAFYTHWRRFAKPAPRFVAEYRFAAHAVGLGPGVKSRLRDAGLGDWRFDFAWEAARVAIELEGGKWTRGRHVRPEGYEADCAKYNAAQLLGWIVLRYTADMLNRDPQAVIGEIVETVQMRALVAPRAA